METKYSQRLSKLSQGDISAIIQMAWEDLTEMRLLNAHSDRVT